ncbi:hypothetical protein BJ878DRAFT_494475 [Calycina marina]|uniref:Uncharacterized protein n=1 Tax=Calycina marina TaxID=1763456 RepID=A0A9P8CH96_9HELO|nr:hypothetical protein BJ878DRAFT_494475 [Calycina marina]
MSRDRNSQLPSDLHDQTAAQIIGDILNTPDATNVSPSGQLFRAVEQYRTRRRQQRSEEVEMAGRRGRELDELVDVEALRDEARASREAQERRDARQPTLARSSSLIASTSSIEPDRVHRRPRLAPPTTPFSGRGRGGASRRRLLVGDRRRASDGSGPTNSRSGVPSALTMGTAIGEDASNEDAGAATRPYREIRAVFEIGLGNALSVPHSAGRRLEEASSISRALLDDPAPTTPSPARLDVIVPSSSHQAREYSSEADHNRSAKRRKLNTEKLDTGFTGFSYGKYGQVEPGPLKMEIVSCDGGIYQEHGDYSAANVLKSDSTVYCTKSNRCNLVLRHQGSTVFNLKELVIKAPHSGYTAPVQEGMVFISMTSDDLLTRTARYQIQYSPLTRRRSSPLPIVSIHHHTDGSTTAQARARRLYEIGVQDEDCDQRTAQIPSEFTANAPSFHVTTEFSDSEDDEQEPRMDDPWIRDVGDDENHTNETIWYAQHDIDDSHPAQLPRSPTPPHRRTRASNITVSSSHSPELQSAIEASQIATQEAVRAVGGGLMVPHARFFIERDKSKCRVVFDPPVAGRFILLKMWSPQQGPEGNIDIQSVVARGFAGSRFFPAVQLR